MAAVLRAILGYYFLVFMMRIAGRRPGKQLTPVDFILVFFSGGLVLTAVVADDRSFFNAISQIIAIASAHYLMVILRSKSPSVARVVDGTPLVLLGKGKWIVETLRALGIQDADVMAIAREQGISQLAQIDYAVLERNGQISVLPKREREE